MSTTGADHGSIVLADGRVGKIVAASNVPAALEHIAGDVDWADSPGIRALNPVGSVVRGSVDRLPLDPVTRRELIAAGIRSLLLVGLHRDDELIGVLSVAWSRDDVPIPSDALAQLAATTHRPRSRKRTTRRGHRPAQRGRARDRRSIAQDR